MTLAYFAKVESVIICFRAIVVRIQVRITGCIALGGDFEVYASSPS